MLTKKQERKLNKLLKKASKLNSKYQLHVNLENVRIAAEYDELSYLVAINWLSNFKRNHI